MRFRRANLEIPYTPKSMKLPPGYRPEFDSFKGILLELAQQRSVEEVLRLMVNRIVKTRLHAPRACVWLTTPIAGSGSVNGSRSKSLDHYRMTGSLQLHTSFRQLRSRLEISCALHEYRALMRPAARAPAIAARGRVTTHAKRI